MIKAGNAAQSPRTPRNRFLEQKNTAATLRSHCKTSSGALSDMDHIAPLFIVGFAGALIGWAMMVLASRIEHDRQERHAGKFGEYEPALPSMPSWARLVSSWLMP